MKWYHFSVEKFEDLRNINHCEFLIMNKQESGKYILENKLRTWSDLRRERALKKEKEKDKSGPGTPSKDTAKLDKALAATIQSPVVAPRRWGGCPDGCNHDKSFRIRSALADLVKRDGTSVHPEHSAIPSPASVSHSIQLSSVGSAQSLKVHGIATPPTTNGTSTPSSSLGVRRQTRRFISEDEEDDSSTDQAESKTRTPQIDVSQSIDVNKSRDDPVSSPDSTPSFISVDARLRGQDMKSPPTHRLHNRGRDFGGSHSGRNSRATSDADSSEEERSLLQRRGVALTAQSGDTQSSSADSSPLPKQLHIVTKVDALVLGDDDDAAKRGKGGMGHHAMANRLGDSPVSSSESGCCAHLDHEHEGEHADDEREKGAERDVDELSDLDDLDQHPDEKEERSVKESVY